MEFHINLIYLNDLGPMPPVPSARSLTSQVGSCFLSCPIKRQMDKHKNWIMKPQLVGGFNPFEKYARQIGSFPQVGVKIKNVGNHHPARDQGKHSKKSLSCHQLGFLRFAEK